MLGACVECVAVGRWAVGASPASRLVWRRPPRRVACGWFSSCVFFLRALQLSCTVH